VKITIDIEPADPAMRLEKALRNNLESVEWAIKKAPVAYLSPLMGTVSIINGIIKAAEAGGVEMQSTVTVPLYGGYGSQETIVMDEIESWGSIEFNGNPGSRIHLKSGRVVRTEWNTWRLEEAIKKDRRG
jgi:hypothetical protein